MLRRKTHHQQGLLELIEVVKSVKGSQRVSIGPVLRHLLWVRKQYCVLIKTTSKPKILQEVPVTKVISNKKAEP